MTYTRHWAIAKRKAAMQHTRSNENTAVWAADRQECSALETLRALIPLIGANSNLLFEKDFLAAVNSHQEVHHG